MVNDVLGEKYDRAFTDSDVIYIENPSASERFIRDFTCSIVTLAVQVGKEISWKSNDLILSS